MIDFRAFSDELMKIAGVDVTKLQRFIGKRTRAFKPEVSAIGKGGGAAARFGDRYRAIKFGRPKPAPAPSPVAAAPEKGRFLGFMPGDVTYEKRLKAGLNPTGR